MAVYQQLAETLAENIKTSFKVGDYLPSEVTLAKQFSVNRHTLRRAIDELERAGIVLRQHGKGTLIIDDVMEYQVSDRPRFTEIVSGLGLATHAELLECMTQPADRQLARAMRLSEGADLWRLDTLRTVEETPLCLISHFLPKDVFPKLDQLYLGGSLHRILDTHYGIRPVRKHCVFRARLPDLREATLLRCPKTAPVLVLRSTNVEGESGRVVEYAVSRSRASDIQMRVDFAEAADSLPDGGD